MSLIEILREKKLASPEIRTHNHLTKCAICRSVTFIKGLGFLLAGPFQATSTLGAA